MFKKIFAIFTVTLFLVPSAVLAFSAAEMQTKKERDKGRGSYWSGEGLYEKIYESFLREDYASVDLQSNDYLKRVRSGPNKEDVLYLQALSLMKLGRNADAREKLYILENTARKPDRKAAAASSAADTYYFENQYAPAYELYEKALNKYAKSDQAPYLLYRLYELSPKLGNDRAAYFEERILKEHPYSHEAYDVKHASIPVTVAPVSRPLGQIGVEESARYSVQVGSFAKQKNASSLADTLLHDHFDAYIERDPTDHMYRVRVGRLTSRDEALSLESRLKKLGYPTRIHP